MKHVVVSAALLAACTLPLVAGCAPSDTSAAGAPSQAGVSATADPTIGATGPDGTATPAATSSAGASDPAAATRAKSPDREGQRQAIALPDSNGDGWSDPGPMGRADNQSQARRATTRTYRAAPAGMEELMGASKSASNATATASPAATGK